MKMKGDLTFRRSFTLAGATGAKGVLTPFARRC